MSARQALLVFGRSAGLAGSALGSSSATVLAASATAGSQMLATRGLGRTGIPDAFARPSKYTEGTDFLGTPKDHLELLKKRPVSPDVLNTHSGAPFVHYAFPVTAISSIINRVTGAGLSVGFAGVGAVALVADVPTVIEMYKEAVPFLVMPTKAIIAFPFVYHLLGGLRHLWWDHSKLGNNADKTSPLDMGSVPTQSMILMGASVVGTLGIAAM